ncbi:protein NO VEIN-like isoform X2 [Polyodon spathula]|uniref:protein NO VEIN-like isoform X2 n=1 Tax=Polyodon spathula TaxID=7913 RepID=UPI001B7EF15A|nr:protein NO VEIN-like isoform X2 [Polyodon spathula]
MDQLKEEIYHLCSFHTEGIPVLKLPFIYRQTYSKQLNIAQYGFKSLEDLLEIMLDTVTLQFDKKGLTAKAAAPRTRFENFTNVPITIPNPLATTALTQKASSLPATTPIPPPADDQLPQLREELNIMFQYFPDGIELSKIRNSYKTMFNRKLKLSEYGFASLKDLLLLLGDTVCVERQGEKNIVKTVRATATPPRPMVKELAETNSDQRPYSVEMFKVTMEKVQRDVLELLKLNPDGIHLKRLTVTYSQRYKRNLTVSTLGFPSLTAFIESMKDELHLEGELILLGADHRPENRDPTPAAAVKRKPPMAAAAVKKQQSPQPADSPGARVAIEQIKETTPGVQAQPAVNSPADFPVLGGKLSRSEQKELKEEAMKKQKSSSPVFKEAYHSQMREMHMSNMQAVEALQADDMLGGDRRRVNVEEANALATEFIRAIASDGEHVTIVKVISRICRHLRIPALKRYGIIPQRDLPAVKELSRTLREVNIFIEAFEAVRTVCTLHEIGQCLAGLKNKKHFEELELGPLCKLPLIYKMFKVPSTLKDEDIREIETVDILKSLCAYMREHRAYRSKVDLAEFMQFMVDQYNCDSPYELGIRIHSIALLVSTLRKAQNSEHASMGKARMIIEKEIEEEAQSKMRKIKKALLDPANGPQLFSTRGSIELRKKYASLTAAEVVLEVFNNAEGVFNKKMTKHVQDFLLRVVGDRLAMALFQLAICCGSLEVPQDLVAKEKNHKPAEPKEQKSNVQPPSEAELKQNLQKHLSNCNGLLNLPYLAKIERRILEHFKFEEFVNMNQGTFLEFLVKHSQVLQEAGGAALVLSSQDSRICGYRPSQQDIYELIRQCGVADQERFHDIESALRSHYKVKDSRELGYGSLATLVNIVQRQNKLHDDNPSNQTSLVYYETALLIKDARHSLAETNDAVGLLGDISRDTALACLLNTPLLEDLADWSQWELVFHPQHGDLKDFIERNFGRKVTRLGDKSTAVLADLVAVEVKPGVLLRVTTHTSVELFAEAAMALDPVGTAGHLVSLVIADGIANAPIALLANHMETSLAAAGGQEEFSLINEEAASLNISAKFILDCLIRIPTRLCKSLLQQVFLDPFSRVVGQANSKIVLLQVAKSCTQYQNRLHQMAILQGVTEWVKDFHMKLSPPKLPVVKSKVSKPRPQDAVSESSRSSVVALSEDEEFDLESLESESESDSDAPLPSSDEDEDEDEKFLLASESIEQESESLDPSSIEGDLADVDSGGVSEPKLSDIKGKEKECRAVIEDIRKSEFGCGVLLNEEGKKLMEVHQNRLGRSLERLSTELYSKDTHFVLELIQNADDNCYPSDGSVHPSLVFVVERDCVTILNNECGFEEKNIRAICDVGRSTKGKHTYGYIGQKGIGFKSVFKVTDIPEIHSNGFHICFDKNSGPMGYILPHWLENERPLELDGTELQSSSWTTKIILPLRSESHQTRNLFHDVHPSLLLFLHRLRSISIVNQIDNRFLSITRKDLSNNVLEVHHTDGVERWLVVKRSLSTKKIKENVECTELALAFKINERGNTLGFKLQPEKQPVFAFLPLRSFGFRFIIQGDFDIPSSREDVDRDSPWNQWLRSEIAQLFLHAMDTFTEHPDFEGLQGLCEFLQFIPLPDEIFDFFKPVAGQIIQLLKGKACLPTKEDQDGNIEFKLPSQIAVSQDVLMQEVICPELLHRHLNLSYLNPVVQSALPSSLISALGVHRLTGSDITTVTSAMAKEMIEDDGTYNDDSLKKIAKLLVCNFRSLEQEYGAVDSMLQVLKSIRIIPLADGRMVSLNSLGVFFPLCDSQNAQTGLEAIYKDLNTVNPKLLECLDPLSNSQVKELLKKLDVHDLEPEKVILEHILPILKNGYWKEKPEDIVISYVVFIKQHSSTRGLAKLKTFFPVLTNKGFVCPYEHKVQFSKEYGNIDLPSKLPGVDWVLLHPCYLRADADVSGWRELFSVLGVQDLLIFRKEKRSLTKKELASSPWAFDNEFWQKTTDDVYVIEDCECEEFHSLITADHLSEKEKLGQREELLSLLDRNWETGDRYSQYQSAQVFDSQGRKLRDTKSSFALYLTTLPWVPAYKMEAANSRCAVEFLCPNNVYLKSSELYKLLGDHVSYVSIQLNPSEFSGSVGIKSSISVEEVITLFKSWSSKNTEGNPGELEGADFVTTVDHIYNVYLYLYENCKPQQLKTFFQQTPAVFVEYERKEEFTSGRFYFMKEVCWTDPTRMFQRYRDLVRQAEGSVQEPHVLAPFYKQLNDMKDLFLKTLNIEVIPSMKQYVDLLELVCSKWSLPTSELLQDVSVIYAILAEKCTIPDEHEIEVQLDHSYCKSLKEMLKDRKVFPSKGNCWVSLAQQPLIPDNKTVERFFKSYSQVCLLNLPAADLKPISKAKTSSKQGKHILKEKVFNEDRRALFLEICGVRSLSQCISVEAQTENYRPCPSVQLLVHKVVPDIQKFIYQDFSHIHKELQENNIAGLLKSLSFVQVGKLYIQYQLTLPDMDPLFEKEDVICLLKDRQLYIQKDHIKSRIDICREVVKIFSKENKDFGKELERFLQGLMSCLDDEAALKRFLHKEDICDLPENEEKWEVPKPLEIEQEPKGHRFGEQLHRAVSTSEEEPKAAAEDGEKTLVCWPPKSSMSGVSHSPSGQAADMVMKMWPPPAQPSPSADAKVYFNTHGNSEGTSDIKEHCSPQFNSSQSSGFPPHHTPAHDTGVQAPALPDPQLQNSPKETGQNQQLPPKNTEADKPVPSNASLSNHQPPAGPAVYSVFQGSASLQRPPLPLDCPVWAQRQPHEALLEDLTIESSVSGPQAVVFTEDTQDNTAIGEWGEHLVYAFLLDWKENGIHNRPREIVWNNRNGESGQPCDFKVTFATDDGVLSEVFIEVKATVKAEKCFIHLSANELHLALKEKERYHLYRVYNAGDTRHVRLCRIKNLAQCLHAKELELFLFV